MFNGLGIPNQIANGLPTLRRLVDDRDGLIREGFAYEVLIQEMREAIASHPQSQNKFSRDVWIASNAIVHENVVIEGPAIIGPSAEIGPSAYLRPGTVVGQGARIGFGVELKATVVGARTKVTHRAYIGNSVICENCDISAGVVIAPKRFDEAPVSTWFLDGRHLSTSMPKLGAWIGRGSRVGAGALIMPGTVVGENSIIWPNAIVSSQVEAGTKFTGERTSPFDVVKLLVQSHYKENELFWKRNAVFVTISGGLFALLVALGGPNSTWGSPATLVFSVFGLSVALAWVQVVRMSKHYSKRVEDDLFDVLQGDQCLAVWLRTWARNREQGRPAGPKATATMLLVAWISVVLWSFLALMTIARSPTLVGNQIGEQQQVAPENSQVEEAPLNSEPANAVPEEPNIPEIDSLQTSEKNGTHAHGDKTKIKGSNDSRW